MIIEVQSYLVVINPIKYIDKFNETNEKITLINIISKQLKYLINF